MIVVDTSFLVAYHNTRDAHHEAAAGTVDELLGGRWGAALLPEYVFLEVATVLAIRRDLRVAVDACSRLLDARELELVPCSSLFSSTWDVFRSQGRLGLSFADAAIVALCRARGARHVATFDSGFAAVPGIEVVPG